MQHLDTNKVWHLFVIDKFCTLACFDASVTATQQTRRSAQQFTSEIYKWPLLGPGKWICYTFLSRASSAVVFQAPCPSTEPSINARVIKTCWLEYFRARALLNSVCPWEHFIVLDVTPVDSWWQQGAGLCLYLACIFKRVEKNMAEKGLEWSVLGKQRRVKERRGGERKIKCFSDA